MLVVGVAEVRDKSGSGVCTYDDECRTWTLRDDATCSDRQERDHNRHNAESDMIHCCRPLTHSATPHFAHILLPSYTPRASLDDELSTVSSEPSAATTSFSLRLYCPSCFSPPSHRFCIDFYVEFLFHALV